MALDCLTTLPDTPIVDCRYEKGAVARLAFQVRSETSKFDGTNDINLQATWDTFTTAVDQTKIYITPILDTAVIPQSEAVFTGDGTNAFGGRTLSSENAVLWSFEAKGFEESVITDLRKLNKSYKLTVYPIYEGNIVSGIETGTAGEIRGIDVLNGSFFCSSIGKSGRQEATMAAISFQTKPNWNVDEQFPIVDTIPTGVDLTKYKT